MVEIGDNLVTGHHTGDICWWNLSIQATQSLLSKCKKSGHDHLRAMVIQSSGPTLVSAGDDGKLRWWNQDKELIAVSTQSIEPIESLAVTPNGRLLSGHGNGDVRWWDHQTPLPPLERFKSSLGPVDKLVYLAGNSFVSAETSTIHWWPGGVHGEIQYDINASRITSLAKVSRTQVVSGDNNGTLQRWQQGGRLGKPVQTSHKYGVLAQVVQHELQATPPFWRPILITGGAPPEEKPATLSVWYSGLNYQENGVLPRHEVISTGQQEVQSLLKTKDGDLISGGARGSIKVLSPKKLVAEACREYKRILARPRDEVAKQASQLCNAQPPDAKWTNLWRWIPFWWHWWL